MHEFRRERVLHVVPDSATNPEQPFLGSTKDIRGRAEYFAERGLAVDTVPAERRDDVILRERLRSLELRRYRWALFEHTLYPRSLRFLRERDGAIELVTRAHNAEFLHRLHGMLAGGVDVRTAHGLRILKGDLQSALTRLRLDRAAARASDRLLAITPWEREHYWRFLKDRAAVLVAPYYLPDAYAFPPPAAGGKKAQCVCLLSTTRNPLLEDAVRSFARLVGELGSTHPEWSFLVTGDWGGGDPLPARVQVTGVLETPFELLAESRAIAILSDYGFGFKTKILEAVRARCYVLLPRKLHRRLPEEVRPFCLVVDTASAASFADALEHAQRPYPAGDPNVELRHQAFAALDEIFGR